METETLKDSKVVTTIMSNMGLYKALDELGIGYEKTLVGDKYVAENMRENGILNTVHVLLKLVLPHSGHIFSRTILCPLMIPHKSDRLYSFDLIIGIAVDAK